MCFLIGRVCGNKDDILQECVRGHDKSSGKEYLRNPKKSKDISSFKRVFRVFVFRTQSFCDLRICTKSAIHDFAPYNVTIKNLVKT
jgi:hypothetical protein